jgi:hypothetical protein
MAELMTPPAWVMDDTVMPPYPILRCPRCKTLFDDFSIHICKDLDHIAHAGHQPDNP